MKESILVVEEESQVLKMYQDELEALGYEVECASSREAAIKKFRAHPTDLILIDLPSSEASQLKSLEDFLRMKRDVKLIVNTKCPPTCDFNYWMADAVMSRPTDLATLGETVRGVLR
jgi:DNA-binding NtrC family response regulator